ncbi:hypothetical protein DRF75_00685 [Ehrlichia minasensis]|uniref:Uncharacterized protein n=1 Tax=Ehrlichia minasensis TaxID=1242993 RepID=A0A4Q6I796_9RICK|nr:hypothetical protein [Ehrlichia minasensis]RZB13210.1 hypothetical protein DRF75_00685 [Ehrlichia minasensis]CEI85341.1 Uncharacterized protein ehr_00735 [Ehrlichia minasensis]
MDLILLLLTDGKPCLVPTNQCRIKRDGDGRIKHASMVDRSLNFRLGPPNSQSPYASFHTLFLSRFMRYVISTSEHLPADILFLFGKSDLLNKKVCMVLKIPKCSLRDFSEMGSILDNKFLVGHGMQDMSFDDTKYRDHAINLFNGMKDRIKINSQVPGDRNHILSFYDSEGSLYHTEYVTSKVQGTIVNPVTNSTTYTKIMN